MKSIKEKAKEVFPEHCNFYTNSCNERKRIGFEVGANYVLEEIETLLTTEFICGRVATDRLKLLEIHSRIKELKGEK